MKPRNVGVQRARMRVDTTKISAQVSLRSEHWAPSVTYGCGHSFPKRVTLVAVTSGVTHFPHPGVESCEISVRFWGLNTAVDHCSRTQGLRRSKVRLPDLPNMEPLEFQDRGGGVQRSNALDQPVVFHGFAEGIGPSDLWLYVFPGGTFIGFFSFHPSRGTLGKWTHSEGTATRAMLMVGWWHHTLQNWQIQQCNRQEAIRTVAILLRFTYVYIRYISLHLVTLEPYHYYG